MNLKELFEIQRKLDERIEQEHPRETGEDRLAKKILALQVELGELANEQRSWKFWSHDQKPRIKKICSYCNGRGFHDFFDPFGEGHSTCECGDCEGTGFIKDRNPLLEEYVDCLHFILSIGLELKVEPFEYWAILEEDTITDQFNEMFYQTTNIDSLYQTSRVAQNAFEVFAAHFFALGEMLGFTQEEIEAAYMEKNATNYARQENGY